MLILEATLDELCEHGYAGFAFERVAIAAGVARTTIYRRWPTKDGLVVAAINVLRERSVVPNTGDLRADLVAGVDNMIQIFASRHGKAIATVLNAGIGRQELAALLHEQTLKPMQIAFRAVMERGLSDGTLELTMSVDETVSALTGIAFVVVHGGAIEARPGLAAGVVSMALDGIGRPRTERRGKR